MLSSLFAGDQVLQDVLDDLDRISDAARAERVDRAGPGCAADLGPGVADLFGPCDFTLSDHTALPTQKITITGTNVWDARVVTFRPTISGPVTTAIPRVRDAATIEVTIPEGIDPLVTVELATRFGDATSASATLFVNDVLPPVSTGPIVWGTLAVAGVPPGAGDQVRILGTGLAKAVEVTFDGVAADLSTLRPADPDSPFPGDSDITITLPPGVSGAVEVAVTTSAGTSGPFPLFSQLVCR